MVKSRIGNVRVTRACLDDQDCISIDQDLLDAADLTVGEVVSVRAALGGWQVDRQVAAAAPGSGTVAICSPGAHPVEPGDRIVIVSYAWIPDVRAAGFVPRMIQVDRNNRALRANELQAELIKFG